MREKRKEQVFKFYNSHLRRNLIQLRPKHQQRILEQKVFSAHSLPENQEITKRSQKSIQIPLQLLLSQLVKQLLLILMIL